MNVDEGVVDDSESLGKRLCACLRGEGVISVVLDDGGEPVIGVRITLSIRLRACAQVQSLEALLIWMRAQTKYLPSSLV